MKKLFLALAITALFGGALVSPSSADLVALDFSQAQIWNAANPDPSTMVVGSTYTFNDVNGVAGCSMTVGLTGGYNGNDLLAADGFDNRTNNTGSNTWTVNFNQALDFQIEMTTHHGPLETNTLGITGGTFAPASFTVINDLAGTGNLPAVFSGGDTSVVIGPYSSPTPGTGTAHPEWTLDGTGTGFTFTNENTNGNGLRNQFVLLIDDATHAVPEPSSVALMALGLVGLVSRRRR